MRRLLLHVALFLFGVFLAAVVLSGRSGKVPERPSAAPPAQTLSQVEAEIAVELAQGRGLERLKHAVEEGSITSLHMVRAEFLRPLANYTSVVLPALKQEALRSLLGRFSAGDWEDWPRAAFGVDGRRSQAREFVDDLLVLNRDLGSFLETAALLFSRLFDLTREGKALDLGAEVRDLMLNAESLLADRSNRMIPARLLLTPTIIIDPVFLPVFERERGRLVAQYLRDSRSKLPLQLGLIRSLDATYCEPDVFLRVAAVIKRLSRLRSSDFRREALNDEALVQALDSFALGDSRVAAELAELYAVGAVDALEARDFVRARRLLQDSTGQKAGLPEQREIRTFLTAVGAPLLAEPARAAVLRTSSSNPRIVLIAVVAMGVVAGTLVLLLRLRGSPPPAPPPEEEPVPLTYQWSDDRAAGPESFKRKVVNLKD